MGTLPLAPKIKRTFHRFQRELARVRAANIVVNNLVVVGELNEEAIQPVQVRTLGDYRDCPVP